MKKTTIEKLKRDDFFILKRISKPKESQVYVRGGYDYSNKRYCGIKFTDICSCREFKKGTIVYVDFFF